MLDTKTNKQSIIKQFLAVIEISQGTTGNQNVLNRTNLKECQTFVSMYFSNDGIVLLKCSDHVLPTSFYSLHIVGHLLNFISWFCLPPLLSNDTTHGFSVEQSHQ
ncbi:unnamed protein product [Schistosoma haematobium]|nr:unnamed protein product [Schistosoma haematobium]